VYYTYNTFLQKHQEALKEVESSDGEVGEKTENSFPSWVEAGKKRASKDFPETAGSKP